MILKKSKWMQKISLGTLMLCASMHIWAQGKNIGTVASNIRGTISAVTKLITATAYVGGSAMFLIAVFQFRQHKENPTQTPLSKPMMFLAIAAALLFFPSLINVTGGTLFGATAKTAGASGWLPS